jgi:hypothetical protein
MRCEDSGYVWVVCLGQGVCGVYAGRVRRHHDCIRATADIFNELTSTNYLLSQVIVSQRSMKCAPLVSRMLSTQLHGVIQHSICPNTPHLKVRPKQLCSDLFERI